MQIKTALTVSLVYVAVFLGNAQAQTQSTNPQDQASSTSIGEIIVTARKRDESLQKVPVTENVVGPTQLAEQQIVTMGDLSARVPGLSLGESIGTSGPQISLRGVGTSQEDPGIDQSVSLNIDGLSLTQGLALNSALFDLAQIEVLKGPQALFFGKNSTAGVIDVRTADPGNHFEALTDASYDFVARERIVDAIVSDPVTDTLGLRLAARYDSMGGFFHNDAIGDPALGGVTPAYHDISNTESYLVRGTVLWRPADEFNVRLKMNVTRDNVQGDSGEGQLASCPNGTSPVPGIGLQFLSPLDNCQLDRNTYIVDLAPSAFKGVPNNGVPYMIMMQKFGTLEMNYLPVPHVMITSVTGYYLNVTDSLFNGVYGGDVGPTLGVFNNFHRRDFTEEMRADTEFEAPVNVTFGAFYQNADVFQRDIVLGNTDVGLPALLLAGTNDMHINSLSGFGQVRWRPISTVEIAGGARYTDERRDDTAYGLLTGAPVVTPLVTPNLVSKHWSPEVTVTYTPTDDVTLYGSLKVGWKSGSYTLVTPAVAGVSNSFGDEEARGGEVGLKTRFFERTLTMNLALYDYKYEGLQVGAVQPTVDNVPVVQTINAGGARVYGVDFDSTYRTPVDGLRVNAAINWNHARFTDLQNAPCSGGQTVAEGCVNFPDPTTGLNTAQNLNGLRLVRAPDWQINAGPDYEKPIGNNLKMNAGANVQYSSQYPTTLTFREDSIQQGYYLLNANIGFGGANDRWKVSFVGNNLTDKITTGSCLNYNGRNGAVFGGEVTGGAVSGPAGIDEVACIPRRGRELWLKLGFKY